MQIYRWIILSLFFTNLFHQVAFQTILRSLGFGVNENSLQFTEILLWHVLYHYFSENMVTWFSLISDISGKSEIMKEIYIYGGFNVS